MGGKEGSTGKEEVSSTAYIILAENQRKKKALQETKGKCEQLVAENRLLLEEREANQQETYEVTEFLRKEILRKNEKIASLEALLEQRELLVEQEKASFIRHAETKVNELKAQWGARETELCNQVEFLQKELSSLREFKERQLEIEAEMERLREDNEELRQAQEAKAAELERKFIEQNTKMKKEYEQKLEELKKSSEEDIDERLDASVKRILQQNRRMAEELRLHVQETDELQREKRQLEEEKKKLIREVEIKREMEEQYAKRGSKQSREIRDNAAKVASLEKSLSTMMKDFDGERSTLKDRARSELETAKIEQQGLRRLLKLKTRELNNIRRLAQEVVRQRSDVESFLIDSLTFVRENAAEERAGAIADGPTTSGSLPSISGAPTGSQKSPKSSARLDIRDLSWEDRERVLRLLFSKINNASQSSYFANLPPHSFDMSGAGYGEGGELLVGDGSGFPPPPMDKGSSSMLQQPHDGLLSEGAPAPLM
mmetsp:Transcript_12897/g.15564  ORF Transcript_12897/g.15564 Transcript_12897/m.15564 type:complete len:487 (-) Transcript_12897:254-1714(-)|eukprot:CAMPEP_0197853114 /NCGR_PEP_ID=MMETSP1438-20131217/22125_1 /TAXON_ID=1461541 /ORGANISM="Pterosperma sp., Strain CCMP1384" /LENGTH=486 /DNA_ID=CAMNT_0043467413 /DNA_START=334 /DNA_END=1794 /DNA_ORIENTATION=-